eukprot:CAMPEP_0197559776 /NCGR_PEP_ID=MMETSP1320-20131121/21880_1 /TAXON_ID=91990 /ORGANISM="Bolidomonas sp., Strain RCC2347" /LENGTH=45 /DNA_ID= /DNA_START= /DNA_END= /DNA_ORIENTATION=
MNMNIINEIEEEDNSKDGDRDDEGSFMKGTGLKVQQLSATISTGV